jgi:hypothetical protein
MALKRLFIRTVKAIGYLFLAIGADLVVMANRYEDKPTGGSD